jgi:hypothetical protein
MRGSISKGELLTQLSESLCSNVAAALASFATSSHLAVGVASLSLAGGAASAAVLYFAGVFIVSGCVPLGHSLAAAVTG